MSDMTYSTTFRELFQLLILKSLLLFMINFSTLGFGYNSADCTMGPKFLFKNFDKKLSQEKNMANKKIKSFASTYCIFGTN